MNKYWEECIRATFDDCGIIATEEQIKDVIESVQNSHENYSMYSGHEAIQNYCESRAERELRELKQKIEAEEQYRRETKPCKECNTTGIVKDDWGRDIQCVYCDGQGRVKK